MSTTIYCLQINQLKNYQLDIKSINHSHHKSVPLVEHNIPKIDGTSHRINNQMFVFENTYLKHVHQDKENYYD